MIGPVRTATEWWKDMGGMSEGRMREAGTLLGTEPPVLLIRLVGPDHIPIPAGEELEPDHKRYKAGWDPTMDAATLYDATRGWWRVSPTSFARHHAKHAVAVADGQTRAVYTVDDWIGPRQDGRYAFKGTMVREGPVFDAYVGPFGKRVAFPKGSANPIHYWPT